VATQKVRIKIEPRKQFREFIESGKRWAVLVAHRRAGKTVAVVQKLIRCALTHKRNGPPLRYAYIAPTRDQAKDIAWAYLKDYCEKIPATTINESELKITLFNRAVIRLYSGENYERMRGLYFDGIVSDEDADIPPAAFDYVILPCLLDYNGWHTRIGTPKGRNAFYKAYTQALSDPDSYTLMLKASESGILQPEALKAIREKTTADSYAQEMECDFNVGRPGAIYARLVEAAYREQRICKLPVADSLVHTSWDLGSPTNTSVWYWQIVGREIRMIDCDVGLIDGVETITQRVAWMMKKGYAFGKHFLPHDAAQTERGGSSFERELRAAGFANVVVLKRCTDIWTGINGLKGLFPSLVFHSERCAKGIEALESYHTREVDVGRLINSEPVHDWSSHTADAARYMAEAIQQGHVKVGANMTRSMEDMDFEHGFEGKKRVWMQDTNGM
jgi:phage terminase large subunit